MSAPLRLGMVGGGEGAFIGGVHRMAARLDGHWTLVAGALSADPGRAARSGAAIGLAPDRSYADFTAMARAEAARPDGIDAVAIVTPNHLHAAPAIAFLRAGIPVICDKPLAATPEQGAAIAAAVAETGVPFILTHNYSAYPMIRLARAMVAAGEIGAVRQVAVEYPQDWLAAGTEGKQAEWRTDPARAGAGGAIGDIGTHAHHLAGFVTGLTVQALAAELTAFFPGRRVDDDAAVLLRYDGGARGMLWASQIAVGHGNALRLRVHGEAGGLDWAQETPDLLRMTRLGEPSRLLTRAGAGLAGVSAGVQTGARLPGGHPEGYLEAFATLYTEAAALVRHRRGQGPAPEGGFLLPGIEAGLAGMAFVAACLRSSAAGGAFVPVEG